MSKSGEEKLSFYKMRHIAIVVNLLFLLNLLSLASVS